MKKILLLATVADRIDMAETMLLTAKEHLPDWSILIVAQEYSDNDKDRLDSALVGIKSTVIHLPKRTGPHIAKCTGLDFIDLDSDVVICSIDDDMEFLRETDLNPCVEKAMQKGAGLISAGWVAHESRLIKHKIVDEFVKQKLVYTGGGMLLSANTAKIIRDMPRLPYFSDNAMWSLHCYLAGLENFRYRGSVTIHRVCRSGGRKAWVLLGEKVLPPKEYLSIEESKDSEKYKIPLDNSVTKEADELHRFNKLGGIKPDTKTLIDFVKSNGNLTKLFALLKPLVKAELLQDDIQELAKYFQHKDKGLSGGANLFTQSSLIYTCNYKCYLDWFTRNLRPVILEKLKHRAKLRAKICMPVECAIESVGVVGNPSSIIRLKKPADYVNAELIGEGIPPSHVFVNMKLLTSHYHHVHAPCAGVVKRIMPVPLALGIFGKASLTYVVLDTEYGDVALMIVGEAVVQDFDIRVEVGQKLEMLDDIGNFTWGSQVVMLIPSLLNDVLVSKRQYHFIGDTVTAL